MANKYMLASHLEAYLLTSLIYASRARALKLANIPTANVCTLLYLTKEPTVRQSRFRAAIRTRQAVQGSTSQSFCEFTVQTDCLSQKCKRPTTLCRSVRFQNSTQELKISLIFWAQTPLELFYITPQLIPGLVNSDGAIWRHD